MNRSASLSTRRRIYTLLSYLVLVLLALFFVFPLVFMIISAFKNDELELMRDMSSIRGFLPNDNMGGQNFTDMTARVNVFKAFLNSSLIVGVTVILGLVVNSLFAYALARIAFRGRDLLLSGVVALIIIPFQAVAIPLLLLVNEFGWLNSYHVQIIPFVAHAFSIYLFYQFFIALPKELEEAAFVDGANRWRIYWSVIVPLSGPVFATVTVLQFLAQWGNLLWPVMVVRGEQFATLPYMMQVFFGQAPRQWGDIMAYAFVATLPTLLLFLFFQRWFVRSAVGSGVKG
jgi:multiple sugar transport system permease protein